LKARQACVLSENEFKTLPQIDSIPAYFAGGQRSSAALSNDKRRRRRTAAQFRGDNPQGEYYK